MPSEWWRRGCRCGLSRSSWPWGNWRIGLLADSDTPKMVAPKVKDLADRLSDHFDTRVRVDLGRTKGRIVIEFATVDDLERIVAIIESNPRRGEQYRQIDIQEGDIQEGVGAGSAASA